MEERNVKNRYFFLSIVMVLMLMIICSSLAMANNEKVSSFGKYSGYSEQISNGWNRYSVYVPMNDETKIAVDYYLPTVDGKEISEPLPVILHYTRYIRATIEDGTVITPLHYDPILSTMIQYGYIIAVADARGTGASYGVHNGPFSAEETADSYEIIEWLATQDWCDGHIGMHGRSYPGMTQYNAATQSPPHLDAIFPEMAGPILYDFIYRGGTYKDDFIDAWGWGTFLLDMGLVADIAPVDEDQEGTMLAEAIAQHANNMWAFQIGAIAKYRDWSTTLSNGYWSWDLVSSIYGVEDIDESGIAVYHLTGWYDIYTTQQPMMYANLSSIPQKMTIGPWVHRGGYGGEVHLNEFHRWYDYWLKGINNKIMCERPVHYYVMTENNTLPKSEVSVVKDIGFDYKDPYGWQSSSWWPLYATKKIKIYFAAGLSGTVNSVNDGTLVRKKPEAAIGEDEYIVDYTSTTGAILTRWKNGYGAQRPDGTTYFDERTAEDEKALTYTSRVLKKDKVVKGYPVVHLWVTSTDLDGDFFVYLEEVDNQGRSHYVSEGTLRASYRALNTAPFYNFGLPYHRCHEEDLMDLPAEPVELVFDIMGTSNVFDAGHSIRITVACADADNYALYPDPDGEDAPKITVYRNKDYPSYIELPIGEPRHVRRLHW